MPPPNIEIIKIFVIWPRCIFKKGINKTAIIKNLIVVNKNGGNSFTPIFAEINASPHARLMDNTMKISIVFNTCSFLHHFLYAE